MCEELDEVMEGYKETEIGVLPEEWGVVELGNAVSFTKKPRGLKITESAIPFITMDLVPNDEFFIKTIHLSFAKRLPVVYIVKRVTF